MLKLRKVTVTFDDVTALKDISADFAIGKISTIFGANGSGKTTLLKAISGLIEVKSGNIYYSGEDITSLPPEDRVKAGIQYIPDRARIGMKMTVDENLRIGGFLRKKADIDRAVGEVYTLFPELTEKRRSPAGVLSGGQRQMLVIGRAYVSSPKIMLFDEPFFSLSRKMRDVIVELLLRLSKQGITLIIAEHDVEEILPIADSYLVFLSGEIVCRGERERDTPIEELIEDFRIFYKSGRNCG